MALTPDVIEPQYTTDEKSDIALLRVSCYIPNLAVSRKFTAKKLRPKITKQAENAEVKQDFQEDCFTVTVTGNSDGMMKGKIYELNVRKLPKPIVPEESYCQVKEERIVIWLRKKIVESWYPELEEGLDVYEEPPDEEEEVKSDQKDARSNSLQDKIDTADKKLESVDKRQL